MLKTKTDPEGIDVIIQKLQTHLHGRLITKWGLTGTPEKYVSYGRIHRNRTADGYVAEWYEGGKEYREVYWNDSLYATSFFGTEGKELHEIGEEIRIHLIFFVNLAKLKPAIAHRADEEVRKDVQAIIGMNLFGCAYESTEIWVDNCLKEYKVSASKMADAKFDMHPTHCFRINLIARYKKNICNNLKFN